MRALHAVALISALLSPGAVSAQLSHRSVGLEAGLSGVLGDPGRSGAVGALRATAWLEGPAEAVARLALRSGRETGGRGAAALSGTLGLRLSKGTGPLRPQLQADVGWARPAAGGTRRDRLAWGVGAGVEWFPALDLAVSLEAGVRGAGGDASAEVTVSVAAYF